MTFKKDGTDPELARRPFLFGMPTSFGLQFMGAAFALLGLGAAVPQPEDVHRYRRGRRPKTRPKRRPNRLIISKRVRRKHRRARKAA